MPESVDTERLGDVRQATLLASSLAFFVILLDTSIVNLALAQMQQSLATELSGLQWIVDLYALSFASLLLTGGTLADKFGAQKLFLTGIGVFTASSVLCGVAPNLGWLLAGRVLQGVGAALLLPASLTLLRTAFPDPKERARAVGIWIAAGGIANAVGPSLGGMLITAFSWRVIFLVNLPVGSLLIWLAASRVLRPKGDEGRRLDWTGQIFVIAALGSFTWALIEQASLGFGSLWIWLAISLGIVASIGFWQIESSSVEPMLPFDLFRQNGSVRISVIALLHNLGIYGQLFVAGLFLQQILHFTPMAAGLVLLPMTVLIAICAFVSGRLTAQLGPYIPLNIGHLLGAAGASAMIIAARHPEGTPLALIVICLATVGAGAGLASPPMTAALLAALPQDRSGLAGGLLNTSRQIGNVIGIAVLGATISHFGGPLVVTGYQYSWLIAAMALGLNVVLGIPRSALARNPA